MKRAGKVRTKAEDSRTLPSDSASRKNAFSRATKFRHTCNPNLDLTEDLGKIVENISFCLSDRSVPGCPIVQASPGFCAMTGYNMAEIMGRNCRFLQGDDTDPQAVHILREAISNLQEAQVTLYNYRKDGKRFLNMLRVMPIISGSSIYYLGVQLEVPETSDDRLTQMQSRYCPHFPPGAHVDFEHVNKSIPQKCSIDDLNDQLAQVCTAYVISDARAQDCPITYVSPSFCELTGYAEAEVIGKNCRFLQGFNTNPDTVAKIAEAVKCKRGVSALLLNYKKDGTAFWNMLVISCVRNHSGEVEYMVGVQTDVSSKTPGRARNEREFQSSAVLDTTMEVAKIHSLVSQTCLL